MREHRVTTILSTKPGLERADGDPGRSIANDLALHQCLLNTMQNTHLDFLVPQSKMMMEANSPAYPHNFTAELQPCHTYTVLGSLEERSQGREAREEREAVFIGEDIVVWMLDFDCVSRVSMDREGFQQAAGAFWRNDPYFPRPWARNYSTEDRRLWEVFVEEFLCECEVILERLMESDKQPFVQLECLRRMRLAKLWVQDMELEGRKRKIEARIDDVA
ncbi:hypothetical protein E8E13_011503 [Curvularia kusanoi]|uniref:DUF3669 domain-containing protein n=1 Tax=Curvularia kusanoi TaxID=90978 RepID=A0A9P4TPI2_CURKU|nr:hypothetical protein E8E13_011503 [Curvularia kusanoi]